METSVPRESKLPRLTSNLLETGGSGLMTISNELYRLCREAGLPYNVNVILPVPNRSDVFAIRVQSVPTVTGQVTGDVFRIYPPQRPGEKFGVILDTDAMPEAFLDIVAQLQEFVMPAPHKELGLIERLRDKFARAFGTK